MKKTMELQGIKKYGLVGLLALSPIIASAGPDASFFQRAIEHSSRNQAIEKASHGDYVGAQNAMNDANLMAELARAEEQKKAAEAGRSTIVINNNPAPETYRREQEVQRPIAAAEPQFRFISCSEIREKSSGIREYPQSYVDLGKYQFKSKDPMIWTAIIYDKKNSVLNYRIYRDNQEFERNNLVLPTDNVSFNLNPDTSRPGLYKIEYYLDGNPGPIGIIETKVTDRNSGKLEAERIKILDEVLDDRKNRSIKTGLY